MIDQDTLARAAWRKSSFSGSGDKGAGNCVEVAALTDGVMAIRDSKRPDAGPVLFTRAGIATLIEGCKAGEL